MDIREPVVAGFFYPASKDDLIDVLKWAFTSEFGPGMLPTSIEPEGKYNIKSAVVPHAGYSYSGPCAAHTYLAIKEDRIPDTIIILGPNHSGLGYPISVYPRGIWRTPLGDLKVDEDIASKLIQNEILHSDTIAHSEEHSIEVQLPFIIYSLGTHVKIVPITIMDQRLKTMRELAGILIDVIEESKKDVIVIASSDMSHYVPRDEAYFRDQKALEYIENMDIEGFYDALEKYNVTACGYGPIAVAILVAKFMGGKGAVLKYYTSGDIAGNPDSVVGYASVIFGDFILGPPRKKKTKEKVAEVPLYA